MKLFFYSVFTLLSLTIGTATAQDVTFTFSTSETDPFAGSTLNLTQGGSGSLFVFIDNEDPSGNAIDALSLNIFETGSAELTATNFETLAPLGPTVRWTLQLSDGDLNTAPGTLVEESNAATFVLSPLNGIQNDVGPVLHAELSLTAGQMLGTNILNLDEGSSAAISVEGGPPESLTFVNGTVNVTAAVPEPSSALVVVSLGGFAVLRRRR